MEPVQLNARTLNINSGSPIDAEELRTVLESLNIDVAALTNAMNTFLVPVINSLPKTTNGQIDAIAQGLDGTQLYVDNDATTLTDSGLFYDENKSTGDPSPGRPSTIREEFLLVMNLLSKIAGTNVSEYTEELSVSAGDVSNGYITMSDPLNIVTTANASQLKYKVYRVPTATTEGSRVLSSQYTVAEATKRLTPITALVAGDTWVIDYQFINVLS